MAFYGVRVGSDLQGGRASPRAVFGSARTDIVVTVSPPPSFDRAQDGGGETVPKARAAHPSRLAVWRVLDLLRQLRHDVEQVRHYP